MEYVRKLTLGYFIPVMHGNTYSASGRINMNCNSNGNVIMRNQVCCWYSRTEEEVALFEEVENLS